MLSHICLLHCTTFFKMISLPIIDLSSIEDTDNPQESSEWISTGGKIREELGKIGFMYIVNHGISEKLVSNIFALSHQFFQLPLDIKLKYKKNLNTIEKASNFQNFFGYQPTGQGGERLHPDTKYEHKETFDWQNNGKVRCPTEELPHFEEVLKEFDSQCKKLARRLLRLLSLGLNLPDIDFFLKSNRHMDKPLEQVGLYNVKLIHYPAIAPDDIMQPGTERCGEHSDVGCLTFLFQDDAGGLEVKTIGGQWIHAKPIPGSIVVNTGDLIEFWTCGIFPATPHRVVLPNEEDPKRRKSRYTVAFFNGPDTDAVVTPVDMEKREYELERLATAAKVYTKDPVVAYDYMMARVAELYGLTQNGEQS